MSETGITKIESDKYTRIIAETVQKFMTDRDFLMTMRASSLYKEEEFDNALVFSTWHFLLETGISQMKDYVLGMEDQLKYAYNFPSKSPIPTDQLFKIEDLVERFNQYDYNKAIDSKENIKIIRNYLRSYNTCLGYGIIIYDMHTALLNGRFAENGGQARKDMKEITKTILQRDYDLQFGQNAQDDRNFIEKLLRVKK